MCSFLRSFGQSCLRVCRSPHHETDTHKGLIPLFAAPHKGFRVSEFVASWINHDLYHVKMSHLDLLLGRIMRLQYRHYMKLTANELIEKLNKRKMHPAAMGKIMQIVEEQKEELRVLRGKNFQFSRMWEELMAPLKYERKVVRALLRYPASEERRVALEAYWQVLDKQVGKMTLQQRARDFTPYQIAKAANFPNNGEHWSDWVGISTKMRIKELFNAIPPKLKAKKKLPFERTIPKTLWATLHARLLQRTEKELAHAEHLLKVAKMKGDQKLIDKHTDTMLNIQQALVWVQEAKVGEALPLTWRGYFYNMKKDEDKNEAH